MELYRKISFEVRVITDLEHRWWFISDVRDL